MIVKKIQDSTVCKIKINLEQVPQKSLHPSPISITFSKSLKTKHTHPHSPRSEITSGHPPNPKNPINFFFNYNQTPSLPEHTIKKNDKKPTENVFDERDLDRY